MQNSQLSIEEISSIVAVGLEKTRKNLLDLSARNRLLNFKFTGSKVVRFVDEIPNQIFSELLNRADNDQRKGLEIAAIPLPKKGEYPFIDDLSKLKSIDPKSHAEKLGISTDWEMLSTEYSIAEKHKDDKLQTLLYPEQLDRLVRRIQSEAKTAVEESGVNMLFLCIGFLRWRDSEDSKIYNSAPLILIPIEIEREKKANVHTGFTKFRIKYTGEDILDNICLREKLLQFAIDLPRFENYESPEEYFSDISKTLTDTKPDWSIERFVNTGFLAFGKMLMYLDLDPTRWPEVNGLSDSIHIVNIFSGNQSKDGSIASEFDIDFDSKLPQPPLVMDADSSQHSAIVDVLKGRSIVIEGPPGTGKSQTITNLIAASLAEGKTVLFVAEKLAALEVVRKRLNKIGLGDFCLELHSHKSQKKALMADLKKRLELNTSAFSASSQLAELGLADLNQKKKKLIDYVQALNKPVGKIRQTPHFIFWKTDALEKELSKRYRHEDFEYPKNVDDLTGTELKTNVEVITNYADKLRDYFGQDNKPQDHFWQGFFIPAPIDFASQQDIYSSLKVLAKKSMEAESCLKDLLSYGFSEKPPANYQPIYTILEHLNEDDFVNSKLFVSPRASQISYIDSTLEKLRTASKLDHELNNLLVENYLAESKLESVKEFLAPEEIKIPKSVAFFELESANRRIEECVGRMENTFEIIDESRRLLNFAGNVEDFLGIAMQVCLICSNTNKGILHYRNPAIEDASDRLEVGEVLDLVSRYTTEKHEMEGIFDFHLLPKNQILIEIQSTLKEKNIFSFLMPKWRASLKAIRRFYKAEIDNHTQLINHLEKLIKYNFEVESFQENKLYNELFPGIFSGIATDTDRLKAVVGFYNLLRDKCFEIPKYGTTLHTELKKSDSKIFAWFAKYEDQFSPALESIKTIRNTYANIGMDSDNLSLDELIDRSNNFNRDYTKVREFVSSMRIANTSCISSLDTLVEKSVSRSLAIHDFNIDPLAVDISLSFNNQNNNQSENILSQLRQLIVKVEQFPSKIITLLLSPNGYNAVNDLKSKIEPICAYQESINLLSSYIPKILNFREFWGDSSGSDVHLVGLIRKKLSEIESKREAFYKWCEILNCFAEVKNVGQGSVLNSFHLAKAADVSFSDYALLYQFLTYYTLSNRILRENESLGSFTRISHENIRKSFKEIDQELKKLNSQVLARAISQRKLPEGFGGRSPKEFTDLTLIRHELGKQKAHIPIRQLVARSYDALVSMKPCFMMGPLSVAQYLAPEREKFDILIMDEASQVRPEDAVGLIARAKQIVVVGDSNQLPPTGFFDTLGDNQEDEEESVVQNSESILDVCKPMLQPIRRLKWHYRSQHQSLISFSNHHFYDGDLVVFPSPVASSDHIGVKHVYVSDGRYENQTNIIEAKRVVQDFIDMSGKFPDLSYGIVTLNAKQKIIIEDEIDKVRRDNPVFDKFLADSENGDEYFVKNLENVQGDERDVIYISTTFGRNQNNNLLQNFGPIVGQNGWRRLNVLFTRAKQHVRIFSSFYGEELKVVDAKEQRGLRALKEYLQFAANGIDNHYSTTTNEPENDFEKSVGACLRSAGYEIEYQLGVSGYLIDMVVKHPRMTSNYVIAIECDGATYHSAKSARDRDRLRESHLRNLGWNHIYRIWSTDWFKRRSQEETRLLHAVETAIKDFDFKYEHK